VVSHLFGTLRNCATISSNVSGESLWSFDGFMNISRSSELDKDQAVALTPALLRIAVVKPLGIVARIYHQ
jgi:hypothetical protein